MSAPNPATTPWVPLWTVGGDPPKEVPVPVDGQWLKGGPGGSMLWAPAPIPPGIVTPDTAWKVIGVDIPFQNGWITYGTPYGPPRFRKLSSGLVVMEGLMSSGTAGAVAFILPVGYRPSKQVDGTTRDQIFQSAMGGNVAQESIRILDDGQARPSNANAVPWITLSGISFYAP